jgi:hypothetical protein
MNDAIGQNGVATGNGNQNIKLANVKMNISTGGTNEVETGNGIQNIVLSHVQMTHPGGGANEVSTGSGTTVLNISNSQFTAVNDNQFFTGTGTTILTMWQVDITAGADSAQNLIGTGNGKASIALSNVNMKVGDNDTANLINMADGTAILTAWKLNMISGDNDTDNVIQSDGSNEVYVLSNLTMSGGVGVANTINSSATAVVSITNWKSVGDTFMGNFGGRYSLAITGANMSGLFQIGTGDEPDTVALANVRTDSLDISLTGGTDLLTLVSCTANTTMLDGGSGNNTLVRVHDSLGSQTVTNFQDIIG